MASRPHRRPSTLGFWLGGVLALAGVGVGAASIATAVVGFGNRVEDLARVDTDVPAVVLLEPGRTVVYLEPALGVREGEPLPAASVRVRDESGEPLRVERPGSRFTYQWGAYEGIAVARFEARRAGRHEVAADAPPGELAIGPEVVGGALGDGLRALAALLGGPLLGGLLALWTGVRRAQPRPRPG